MDRQKHSVQSHTATWAQPTKLSLLVNIGPNYGFGAIPHFSIIITHYMYGGEVKNSSYMNVNCETEY